MLIIEGETQEIELEFRLIEQSESEFSNIIDIDDRQSVEAGENVLGQA